MFKLIIKNIQLIILILLVGAIYWQSQNIENLSFKILNIQNSMDEHNKNLSFSRWERSNYYSTIQNVLQEPNYPCSNESIYETHWIKLIFGWQVKFIKLELRRDSSISMTYKFATLKNINNNSGFDRLIKQSTQKLDKAIWNEFKEKLQSVDIYDAAYWNGYDDCMGESLDWEAVIGNKHYQFSTACKHATKFAEACEFIMRQVNDEELKKMFKQNDELIKSLHEYSK